MCRRILLVGLLFLLTLGLPPQPGAARGVAAAPATGYVLTHLPPLSLRDSTNVCALNNDGRAVGYSFSGGGSDSGYGSGCDQPPVSAAGETAVVWYGGAATALVNLPGCISGKAYGINDSGTVVGACWGPQVGVRAVRWQGGTISDLGILPGAPTPNGIARAVNNAGQIVGALGSRAVLWQGGAVTDLGEGGAFGINSAGQVVGVGGPDVAKRSWETGMAMLWQGGTATILAGTSGTSDGRASAINAGGQIVGVQGNNAALWQGGTLGAPLTPPADPWTEPSSAFGVNDRGQVVGKLGPSKYPGKAALWQNGVVATLSELASTSNYLADARGINNAGQIIGLDPSVSQGFLLTPAPVLGDVSSGDPAAEAIAQLTARGIVRGCDATVSPPLFCPKEVTLRHQMAALIVRAMPGWADETWPNTFTDPTSDAELWRRVGTLQHYRVVTGYSSASCAAQSKVAPCYGPTDPVLRAQAISFVTRAMVARGYWVQQPINPSLYGGTLNGTGHEGDAATYWHYTRGLGGVPDYPEGGTFPTFEEAPRDWFARLLWTALRQSGR